MNENNEDIKGEKSSKAYNIKNKSRKDVITIITLVALTLFMLIPTINFIKNDKPIVVNKKNYKYQDEIDKSKDYNDFKRFVKNSPDYKNIYSYPEDLRNRIDEYYLMLSGTASDFSIDTLSSSNVSFSSMDTKIDEKTGNIYHVFNNEISQILVYPDRSFKSYKLIDYEKVLQLDKKYPNAKFDSKENYIKLLGYKENFKLVKTIPMNDLNKYVYIPYEKNDSHVPYKIEITTDSIGRVFEANVFKSKIDEYVNNKFVENKKDDTKSQKELEEKKAEEVAAGMFGEDKVKIKIIKAKNTLEKPNNFFSKKVSESLIKKNTLVKVWKVTLLEKENNITYNVFVDPTTEKVIGGEKLK